MSVELQNDSKEAKQNSPKTVFKDNIQLTTNKMLIRLSVSVTVQNMCMKKQQHTTQLSINCEQYIIEREIEIYRNVRRRFV